LKTTSPRRLQSPSPAVVHQRDPDQVFTRDLMELEKSKMTPPPPKGRTTPAGVVITRIGTGAGRTFRLELSHPPEIWLTTDSEPTLSCPSHQKGHPPLLHHRDRQPRRLDIQQHATMGTTIGSSHGSFRTPTSHAPGTTTTTTKPEKPPAALEMTLLTSAMERTDLTLQGRRREGAQPSGGHLHRRHQPTPHSTRRGGAQLPAVTMSLPSMSGRQ
jgi:hypothetical protein